MRSGFNFFIFILHCLTANLHAQVIVKLNTSGYSGQLELSWPLDPLSSRENVVDIYAGKGSAVVQRLEIHSCQSLRIRFLFSEQAFLIKPGLDTLEFVYDGHRKSWWIKSGNDEFYRQGIEIDSIADHALLKMGRPGTASAVRKAKVASDSLRQKYSSLEPCIADYARLTAAFIELSSGVPADSNFIHRAMLGAMRNSMNPAFSTLFHSLFDGGLTRQLKLKSSEIWEMAYDSIEPYAAFKGWLRKNTGIQNDTLLNWVLLNTVLEMQNTGSAPKDEMLDLIRSMKIQLGDPIMIDLLNHLEIRIRFCSRGNQFPDFRFTDSRTNTVIRLSELKGKPIYLIYLPDGGDLLLENLLYLSAFQKKFGKEISFVALVNQSNTKALNELAQQQGFQFHLASYLQCEDFNPDVLESLRIPGYVLIDRNGLIWQNPAESPVTGVEAAFLNLIRHK